MEFLSTGISPPNEDLLNLMAAIGSQIGQFMGRKDIEQAVLESEALKTGMLADGSEFPVEFTVTGVELPGRRAMFTGFVRDITDRKRAEEASRRLGDIVESSDDSISG